MDNAIVHATSLWEDSMASVLANFAQELTAAAEKAGPCVVTVHARHRVPSSGIYWRRGVVVTANHTVRHISSILDKLGAGTRTEAVTMGIRMGIILL